MNSPRIPKQEPVTNTEIAVVILFGLFWAGWLYFLIYGCWIVWQWLGLLWRGGV